MQIPFFRNFTPGIHFMYAFSLFFIGAMLGEAFMTLLRFSFWGTADLSFNEHSITESHLAYYKLQMIVMPIFNYITPALVFCRLMEFNGQDYLAVRKKPIFRIGIITVLLLVICSPISNVLFYFNQQIDPASFSTEFGKAIYESERLNEVFQGALLNSPSLTNYLINIIAIALFAALGEELVFRGVFQRILTKVTGNAHIAIIIAAALFSLVHASYFGFFTRFFMGIVLGYIYVCTGNLWYSILFHFVNNALIVTIFWLDANGYDFHFINMFGYNGPERWIALGLLIILVGFTVFYIKKLINRPFVEDLVEN